MPGLPVLLHRTVSVGTTSLSPFSGNHIIADISIAYVHRRSSTLQYLIHENQITLNVRAGPVVAVEQMFPDNRNAIPLRNI